MSHTSLVTYLVSGRDNGFGADSKPIFDHMTSLTRLGGSCWSGTKIGDFDKPRDSPSFIQPKSRILLTEANGSTIVMRKAQGGYT